MCSNECNELSEGFRFIGFNKIKKKYILTMKIINTKLLIEAYSESDTLDKFFKIERAMKNYYKINS